jgi:hypothetical protein
MGKRSSYFVSWFLLFSKANTSLAVYNTIILFFVNVSILNFQHTQNPPVIFHAEVESAAPIIWHRRKDI